MNKAVKVLRGLKLAWAVMLFTALGFSSSAFATKQVMTYGVYAGGFYVVTADMVIDTANPGTYAMTMNAKTRGALAKVAPWSGSFGSNGRIMNDTFVPKQHQSVSKWRSETETKTYTYTKNGTFKHLTVKDHDKPLVTKQTEDALTDGTTDVISATLDVLKTIATDGKCAGQSDIFDGKRRFSLIFRPASKPDGELQTSKYNAYSGAAQKCTVEVVPIAGKWREKPRGWFSIQEQGRSKGTMPTVWMASIEDNAPAIPVKVMVKTDYGTFIMHLETYKNGDTILMSKKRKK